MASGPEHRPQHGHSGSNGGRLVTTQGAHRPVMAQYREMPDVNTVLFEKPENLGRGHPGIDVVLQELRAISSRLSQVEHSIDSQSNTRTSTPHRMQPFQSVVEQGCNETTGVMVPVSSSSVGVCFTSALPVSTMASAGCQYTSPPRTGYVPPGGQVMVQQSSHHSYPVHSSVVYTAPSTVVSSTYLSTAPMWQGQSVTGNVRSRDMVLGQQPTRMQNTQGATAGHPSDCVVPNLSTLRNSADIQAQVNARLQELEQANQMNTAGTGSSSSMSPDLSKRVTVGSKGGKDEKISVAWPQDLAFVGTLRKRPQYEDLTQTQWILGFLRIAQEESNPEFRTHMYEYLTELMQDAADNTWAAAKGAHAVLMHRMQDGVLDWGISKRLKKSGKLMPGL